MIGDLLETDVWHTGQMMLFSTISIHWVYVRLPTRMTLVLNQSTAWRSSMTGWIILSGSGSARCTWDHCSSLPLTATTPPTTTQLTAAWGPTRPWQTWLKPYTSEVFVSSWMGFLTMWDVIFGHSATCSSMVSNPSIRIGLPGLILTSAASLAIHSAMKAGMVTNPWWN